MYDINYEKKKIIVTNDKFLVLRNSSNDKMGSRETI